MTRPPSPPPSAEPGPDDDLPGADDALAGEYVLGVLSASERAAVERRLRDDPALRARVADWETHLSPLDAGFDPVPPPDLLPRIEARLFGRQPPRRSLRWWIGAGLGLALGGAVAATVFLSLPFSPTFLPGGGEQRLTGLGTTLAAEDGTLAFTVAYLPETGSLAVTRSAGPAAATGRDYQLWRIGDDGVPVSLGLLRGDTVERIVPDLDSGVVLAVSLEPEGGSPEPIPTGPVLAAAPLTAI